MKNIVIISGPSGEGEISFAPEDLPPRGQLPRLPEEFNIMIETATSETKE